MIVTEEAARKKWCPWARVESEGEGAGSINRDFGKGYALSDCSCLGSTCMAWRWTEFESRSGYCGIAGVPPDA